MTDTSNIGPARAERGGDIDRLAETVALVVALAFAAMLVFLGPCEAMERLAAVLRKLLPVWGR